MKNVVITGADGFVGSNTVNYFLKQGVKVLAVDRRKTLRYLKQLENLTYICCNISDTSQLKAEIPEGIYDTWIHFAWDGTSGVGRFDYGLQLKNVLSTVECMKFAKEIGCSRFLCIGSIMEYEISESVHMQGGKPGLKYIYGIGKQTAHAFCKCIASDIGIELIWPMITNAYGIGEISPRFVNATLRKIYRKEPLQFTSATQNYDFIYVSDVANAIFLVAEKGKPFCEYMIGSGRARPLKEYILEMVHVIGTTLKPVFGDVPYTGVETSIEAFDITDTKKDCGFEPLISFSEGIKKTYSWIIGGGISET